MNLLIQLHYILVSLMKLQQNMTWIILTILVYGVFLQIECASIQQGCSTTSVLATNCTQCSAQCYLYNNLATSQGQCWSCTDYCTSCTTYYDCSICSSPYLLSPQNTCLTCSQLYSPKCAACTTTSCTLCSIGYYLNSTSGNTSCVLCQIYKCLTCVNGPQCTSCQNGYYVNSTQTSCLPCEFPCLECSLIGTNCTSCVNNYYAYNGSNCNFCNFTKFRCLRCSSTTICLQCLSNRYYLNGVSCVTCQSPCKTCLSFTQCQSCINNRYLLNQTTQTCEYCNVSIPFCQTCFTTTICLTCVTNYYLLDPPRQCVECNIAKPNCTTCSQTTTGPVCILCDMHFYLLGENCHICPDICQNCTSLTHCTSCIDDHYYLQNFHCKLCPTLMANCQTCILNVTAPFSINCTFCVNNTLQSGGLCVPCSPQTYTGSIVPQVCIPCNHPCNNCTSATQCTDCAQFYAISQTNISQCIDYCGDYVIITDQCDKGLNIPNDGCSNYCTIQNNYHCFYSTNSIMNGTLVNQSTCSYTGNVLFQLQSTQKPQIFLNKIILTFNISPYLFGLPGTTAQVFTQEELKYTFSLLNITNLKSYFIEVLSSGVLTFTLDYNATIIDDLFQLTLNFSYLYSVMNLQQFELTSDATVNFILNNQFKYTLVGVYYTQSQYSSSKIIYYLSYVISILGIIAFVLSLLTKQISGIQFILVAQYAYISLLWYKQTLDLSYYCLKNLVYSTGFNIRANQSQIFVINSDPPQSKALDFNPSLFSDNFNLMTILYLLPLSAVIVFIPFKAKCIRKLAYIQMGHKWVDLLLGQFQLTTVLFNYQYFIVSIVVYFSNGSNIKNYNSMMIIWIGSLTTLVSLICFIVKPHIYGIFRQSFRYNEGTSQKQLQLNIEDSQQIRLLKQKQQKQQKFSSLKVCCNYFSKFINQNYFRIHYRSCYNIFSANHYTIFIAILTINTAVLITPTLYLFLLSLNGLFVLYLIIVRPYTSVSNKFRSIYFGLIVVFITYARFYYNQVSSAFNFMIPMAIVCLLSIGLFWTYINLIVYFVAYDKQRLSDQNRLIGTIFNKEFVIKPRQQLKEDEQQLMRRLMKKYQKIQLKYNFNNVRDQLLKYNSKEQYHSQQIQMVETINKQIIKLTQKNQQIQHKIQQIQLNQSKKERAQPVADNYINDNHHNHNRKSNVIRKMETKDMLKLLSLDNFNKYQQKYLRHEGSPSNRSIKEQKYQDDEQKEQLRSKSSEENNNEQKIQKQEVQYVSVQPQTVEEAKEKIMKERLILEQNQHLRYQRALKFIKKDGLKLDQQLVEDNYKYI